MAKCPSIADIKAGITRALKSDKKEVILASDLSTFAYCPIQLKMRIDGEAEVTKAMKKGTDTHAAIQEALTSGLDFTPATLQEIIEGLNTGTTLLKPDEFYVYCGYRKPYYILGKPDLFFSKAGAPWIVELKTGRKKPKVHDGDRFQILSYLYMARQMGVKAATGLVLITPYSKEEISEKLCGIQAKGEWVTKLESLLSDSDLFTAREQVVLDQQGEAKLNEVLSRLIRAIEEDKWDKPPEWACRSCKQNACKAR